ncbi:hypothetical protein GGI12_003532 [Dipsacomyces acuminosporus]|nr:hypothetical protein GGI12_003532 [Dipsacomyces acuminosporus]
MGRAPKRTFKERTNPLNSVVVQGAATTVQTKEEVPALLKKLSSAEANDRVWAAASASNLVVSENANVRRLLLANNVISALIERLSDSVPYVVAQASGALRNLAAVDQGAAEEMLRKNIFAAVQGVIPGLAKSIDDIIKQNEDGKKLDTDERKVIFLTADNLISILWALCETVPSCVRMVNSMGLTPFLVSFFNVIDKLPASLVQTAGQFLYTLTDNNEHSHRALLDQPHAIQSLLKVVGAAQCEGPVSVDDLVVIRILAGGILANIKPTALSQLSRTYNGSEDDIPESELKPWEELPSAILQTISQFIAIDVHACAAHAVESVKGLASKHAEDIANGATSSVESKHEIQLDKLSSKLSYVQLALELAANIFTDEGADEGDPTTRNASSKADDTSDLTANDSDEDQNMDEDGDEDESEDDESDDDIEGDFDENDMADILADESTVAQNADEVVQHSIFGLFIGSIVPSLQRLAEPTAMSTISSAIKECSAFGNEEHTKTVVSTVENFVALHERALACLNNFLLVLEESLKAWFGMHTNSVEQWWRHLIAVAEHIFSVTQVPSDLADMDQNMRCTILETAVGCMWTLARGVNGCVPVTPEQIEGLVHVCETAPTPSLRMKAVGVLGNIARRQPGFVNENRRIGAYLLENVISKPIMSVASASTQDVATFEPIIEALDVFYDIYGDMAYDYDDPVFVHGEFLSKLRQLYIPARKMVKCIDRRKHRQIRSRGDLAVQNLRAFIDYKASER